MTNLAKRRNGNALFPFLKNDFLTNRFFNPELFDFENDFFKTRMTAPPANITENDDHFKLDLSVPGMEKSDFKINIENNILIVSSEKEEEINDDNQGYKRKEFSYSSFSRSFSIPDNADENNITAKYDNGMLQITIPKKEVTISNSKKQIEIS